MDTSENKSSLLSRFRKKYPGIVTLITVITTFASLFTAINVWFGVQVRPAWHWEYVHLKDDFNQLKIDHYSLQEMILSRDLARFVSLRERYIMKDESVPDWLDEEIATIKSNKSEIEEQRKSYRDKISK